MPSSLFLIWVALFISLSGSLLLALRIFPKLPRIYYVTTLCNAMTLAFYYAPGLYGHTYYFLNVVKMAPLILGLVWLAQLDTHPNWSYRALCLVFILQIMTGGAHILTNLEFVYYDQFSVFSTFLELLILIAGGMDARFIRFNNTGWHNSRTENCSLWVKRDHTSRN